MSDRGWSAGQILTVVGLIAAAALYLVHVGVFRHYVNDDAFITFRYSRSLASGLGPYFNPGEHVEGYTNFLLMVLLAPIIGVGGESWALPAAKLIGVGAGLTALLLAAALVRSLFREAATGRIAAVVAAGLIAATPFYAVNSVNGLETTLYAALLLAGVCLALSAERTGRWCGAGVAFALAALTRPEGVVIFAASWVARAILVALDEPRPLKSPAARRLALDAAVVAAILGAHLGLRLLWYDGEWLPNTYWAKAGGFWRIAPWPYARTGAGAPFLGIVGLLVGFAGFLVARTDRRRGLPLYVTAAVAALMPFATGSDWMPGFRLVAPYLPLLAAVVAIGWCGIGSFLVRRPAWLGPALALLLLPVAWLVQEPTRASLKHSIDVRAQGYAQGHRALAEWLRSGAAHAGDTVALMDTGIVGYFGNDLRILDITGLTDRFIAKSPGTFLDKQFDPGYVLRQHPAFIVIVLAAPLTPDPLPEVSSLVPWTPIEQALVTQRDFRREYVRPDSVAPPGAPWTEQLARLIGAERVFAHAYPGRRYLLAVFARADRRAS